MSNPHSLPYQDDMTDPLTLSWKDLTLTVTPDSPLCCCLSPPPHPLAILTNVSGCVRPGELVAVIGASGAGKTSLLNTLAQRNDSQCTITGGEVLLNGGPVSPALMRLVSGYIEQEVHLVGTLTVRETLMFYANLRLMGDGVDKEAVVETTMRELGLTKVANSLIGMSGAREVVRGISGGEKKRVSVAAEMLLNPGLLFVDEPTSGLDSFMAGTIIQCLRTLAENNRTILCTIHQPTSTIFKLFHKVCVMADGQIAFFGTTEEAKGVFSRSGYPIPPLYNPADHFVRTLAVREGDIEASRKRITKVVECYTESTVYTALISAVQTSSKIPVRASRKELAAGFSIQLWENIKRSGIGSLRNPTLFINRIIFSLFVGALAAVAFFNRQNDIETVFRDKSGLIFFITVIFAFRFVAAQSSLLPLEFGIVAREYKKGMYTLIPWALARTLVEIPFLFIMPLITLVCVMADGQIAFFGTTEEAKGVFSRSGYPIPPLYNPADHFVRTLAVREGDIEASRKRITKVVECYTESTVYTALISAVQTSSKIPVRASRKELAAGFSIQLWENIKRSGIGSLRNPTLFINRIIFSLFVGALAAVAFFNRQNDIETVFRDKSGLIFFITVIFAFRFVAAQSSLLPLEFGIVAREYKKGMYTLIPWALARTLVEIPFLFIMPLITLVSCYFLTGLTLTAGKFFSAYLCCVLMAWGSFGLGSFLGSCVTDPQIALALTGPVCMVFLVFGGFLKSNNGDVFIPINEISWINKGYSFLMINEFKDLELNCENTTCITNGTDLLATAGLEPSDMWFPNLFVLFAFGVMSGIIKRNGISTRVRARAHGMRVYIPFLYSRATIPNSRGRSDDCAATNRNANITVMKKIRPDLSLNTVSMSFCRLKNATAASAPTNKLKIILLMKSVGFLNDPIPLRLMFSHSWILNPAASSFLLALTGILLDKKGCFQKVTSQVFEGPLCLNFHLNFKFFR
eukprot:sb/3461673/